MTTTIEKKFVSKDGYDLCVLCSKKTQYKTETNINYRNDYVEGAGQLCTACGKTCLGEDYE